VKPVETLYIVNINEVWAYLDERLPLLLDVHYFRPNMIEDYTAMIITQLFSDVLYELTGRYIRPPIKPLFEETLYAFYDDLKYQLLPLMIRIFKGSGVDVSRIDRIDYMATRSGMIVCVARYHHKQHSRRF